MALGEGVADGEGADGDEGAEGEEARGVGHEMARNERQKVLAEPATERGDLVAERDIVTVGGAEPSDAGQVDGVAVEACDGSGQDGGVARKGADEAALDGDEVGDLGEVQRILGHGALTGRGGLREKEGVSSYSDDEGVGAAGRACRGTCGGLGVAGGPLRRGGSARHRLWVELT